MKRLSSVAAVTLAVLLVATVALSGVRMAEAGGTCNLQKLSPCVGAITSLAPPSNACCSKLREQTPCLCAYLRDPNLKQLLHSPKAKKVSIICGVPYPKC